MTSRILPQAEWDRLDVTDIPQILPFMDPDRVQVIVVEEGDRIVGAWAVLTMQHLEGLWIAPEFRGNPRVASRLLNLTLSTARKDSPWAMTAVSDDSTKQLLTRHLSAVHVPGEMYMVALTKGSDVCPSRPLD